MIANNEKKQIEIINIYATLTTSVQQETHQEMRQRTWTFFTTTSYTYYKIQ